MTNVVPEDTEKNEDVSGENAQENMMMQISQGVTSKKSPSEIYFVRV